MCKPKCVMIVRDSVCSCVLCVKVPCVRSCVCAKCDGRCYGVCSCKLCVLYEV